AGCAPRLARSDVNADRKPTPPPKHTQTAAIVGERRWQAILKLNLNPYSCPMTVRRLVFLGHATPQDNAFTRWLGARLTAAGYDVWLDLKRLGTLEADISS
ncbi:hypothetical protein WDZ92_49995, partial [Nostoc sp. NIES-2111]